MEVKFYLMGLIVQFAAPTSHCVGSYEHVWVVPQNQCQNKTETRIVGKVEKKELCEKAHTHHVTKSGLGYNAIWITASEGDISGGLKDSWPIFKKGIGDQTYISALKSIHFLSAVLIISILL